MLGPALSAGHFLSAFLGTQKIPGSEEPGIVGAPEGIRTPNLLIRSQMLYPLSYERVPRIRDVENFTSASVIGPNRREWRQSQRGIDLMSGKRARSR